MKKPCALVLVQDIEGKIVRKLSRGTHILLSKMGFVKTSGVRNTQCKLHSFDRLTVLLSFRLCSTYPKLHIVPAMITDKEMEAVAKFRTSGRFPSVVWR